MSDYNSPTAICNQAIDSAGLRFTLGDIEDGTYAAQVCLRWYSESVRQLLRAAHWDAFRREADLLLLADATGQTANVGTAVPSQFIYAYAYPFNCAKMRFIPRNPLGQPAVPTNNIQPADPDAPLTTGTDQPLYLTQPQIPSRFLITNTPDYVTDAARLDPTGAPGMAPTGRTIICSNVKNAKAVFTFEALYPNLWDHKFRQAVVSLLAAYISIPLHAMNGGKRADRMGENMQRLNAAVAQQAIQSARISDGNEGWYSSDIAVDWLRVRANGGGVGPGWGSWDGPGPGYCIMGWDSVMLPGGSAF